LPSYHKLLVIGLDGGTWDAFDPLIDRGYLPFLADLKKHSSYGTLCSTVPPFTMPAWSTFVTGRNPGNHGVFSFFQHSLEGYNLDNVGEFVNSRVLGPANLWNLLSSNHRKLIAINVPLTYPPQKVNGIMITGMLTPPDSENYTYPDNLKDQLDDYQIDLDNIRGKDRIQVDEDMDRNAMLSRLIDLVRIRRKTCLKLFTTNPYDFAMVVFTSTDRLFHYFWDLVTDDRDLLSEKYSKNEIIELRKKLNTYLLTLDNAIKDLAETAGRDTNIILMSDHGFGSSPSCLFNVNCWLKQQNLLFERSGGQDTLNPLSWIIRLGKSRFIRSITPELLEKKFKSAIRDQKELLLKEITEELLNIEDKAHGRKIVQKVMQREQLFRGKKASVFPDLVFFAQSEYSCSNSLVETEVVRDNPQPQRPGDHRVEGMYLVNGPNFKNDIKDLSINIADLAPTILFLLDIPLLDNFDGQIMKDLIDDNLISSRRPVMKPFDVRESAQGFLFDEKEDEALRERLKNLGYL